MTEEPPGHATPGGEGPSSDRPLAPGEGADAPSRRPPGDPDELGYFTADEEAPHEEQGTEPAEEREAT